MSRPVISENLQVAIERLRPELPELLGTDYATFVTQLEALLTGGNEDQVYYLFRQYPEVHVTLRRALVQQEEEEDTLREGLILHGDVYPPVVGDVILESGDSKDLTQISASVKQGDLFYCPESGKLVELPQDALRNPSEGYRCPAHQQLLSKVLSDNIETQMGKGIEHALLFYCVADRHLVLISPGDLHLTTKGDALCPKHKKGMERMPLVTE